MSYLGALVAVSLSFGAFLVIAFAFYLRGDGIMPFKEFVPGGWVTVVVFLVTVVIGFLLYFSGCVA